MLEGLGDRKLSTCNVPFPLCAQSVEREAEKPSLPGIPYSPVNDVQRVKPYNVVPGFHRCDSLSKQPFMQHAAR